MRMSRTFERHSKKAFIIFSQLIYTCRRIQTIIQLEGVLLPRLPAPLALNISLLAAKRRVIISYDYVYKPVSSDEILILLTFSKSRLFSTIISIADYDLNHIMVLRFKPSKKKKANLAVYEE